MTEEYEIYRIKPGDELYSIMRRHYGDAMFFAQRGALLQEIAQLNPRIKDIDRIYSGRVIALPVRSNPTAPARPAEALVTRNLDHLCCTLEQTPNHVLAIAEGLNAYNPGFNAVGGAYGGLKMISKQAAKDYQNSAGSVLGLYRDYKSGKLSKHQYYKARKTVLDATDQRHNLIRKRFGPAKPATSLLRMSKTALTSGPNTDTLLKPVSKFATRVGRAGGVLQLATVPFTVQRIAAAEKDEEKFVIIAETLGGMAGSAAGVLIVGALVSNPVGWAFMIGAAVTAVGAGAIGSELSKSVAEDWIDSL